MKRKGISPLIAAVLLIAFTMAVASIFAQWAPQLMNEAQGDTSERAQDIQRCSDRTMDLSAQHDNNDNVESVTIAQTGGSDGVGWMTVTWYYENSEPLQNTTSINESRGVSQVSNGLQTSDTVTEVQVNPTDCPGAPGASWEP